MKAESIEDEEQPVLEEQDEEELPKRKSIKETTKKRLLQKFKLM